MISFKNNYRGMQGYWSSVVLFNRRIPVKFDNGATSTVIGIKSLGLERCQEDRIRNYINSISHHPDGDFVSASGDAFNGCLCCMKDVMFDDVKLRKFYFSVVLVETIPIALIGNDFLDYCAYSHSILGDCNVSSFSSDLYEKHFMSVRRRKCTDLIEILGLDVNDDYSRNLARKIRLLGIRKALGVDND